jgi:hypothetical protein
MPEAPRFFELLEHVGVDADGELEPLVATRLLVARPKMVEGEPRIVMAPVTLRPLGKKHPRTVKTDDPAIAEHLLSNGLYREVDPPTTEQTRTARQGA